MTKHVYTSDMVCHLWANKHATETRTPTNNLFTDNGVLYSYGRHFAIAAFMPANKNGVSLLLWNDASTSNTTNKHRSQAYRALTNQQNREAVRVPHLDAGSFGNLTGLARACIESGLSALEKVEKARQNATVYAQNSTRWFDDARRIFEYLGDKKSKVPALDLSGDIKASAAQVLKSARKNKYLANAESAFSDAAQWYENAKNASDARAVCGHCVRVKNKTSDAAQWYEKAGEKAPRKIATLQKTAALLFKTREAEARALDDAETRSEHKYRLRRVMAELYAPKISINALHFELSKFNEKAHGLGTNPEAWRPVYGKQTAQISETVRNINRRANSILNADYFRSQLANLEKSIANYWQNLGYSVPNPETLKSRVSMWKECPDYFKAKAQTVIQLAEKVASEHAEKVARENAEKIEQWRNGARVYLPHGVPTMARIVGDTVETSRGATVPLEHAARLVKIARRIAGDGGRAYDGDGPKVGYFTVQKIRADLSIIIGCHEFSAIEAEKAAQLIESATK